MTAHSGLSGLRPSRVKHAARAVSMSDSSASALPLLLPAARGCASNACEAKLAGCATFVVVARSLLPLPLPLAEAAQLRARFRTSRAAVQVADGTADAWRAATRVR